METDQQIQRRSIEIEIAIVIVAIWLPHIFVGTRELVGIGSRPEPSDMIGLLAVISSAVGQGVIVLLVIWRSGRTFAEFGLGSFQWKHLGWALPILAGLVGIWACFNLSDTRQWLQSSSEPPLVSWFPILEVLVLVPSRELLFRSYLPTRLREMGWNSGFVVGLTALLFGLSFVTEGGARLGQGLGFGLLLGTAFLWLKSTWPGMIAQVLFNLGVSLLPLLWYLSRQS